MNPATILPMKNVFASRLSAALTVACGVLLAATLPAATVLYSGATVHPVNGDPLTNGHVLVRDGRIVSVTATAPAGADEVIQLEGLHLFPGLIDAATILGLNEIQAVRATIDNRETGEFTPEVESWVSVNPDSELIPVARANGVTHVHVVPSGGLVSGQGSVIQLAGWTIEDLAVERRAGLEIFWPSQNLNTSPDNKKSLKDQDRERLEKLRELDTFFDEAAAYARGREAGTAALVPAWEAMLPYVRGERPVFIHAIELRQLRGALAWLQQRSLKGVLLGARDAWQLADELAAAKVPVVYDAVFALPKRDDDPYDVHYHAPAVLHAAGVKVAVSLLAADNGRQKMEEGHARNLPYEAAQAMAYGLPADAALKSVTLHPAEMLGLADRLGSLEPGKEATFIAVTGDILDIRSQVRRMWIAGREVSLETRHTRLYEKYRNRPQ